MKVKIVYKPKEAKKEAKFIVYSKQNFISLWHEMGQFNNLSDAKEFSFSRDKINFIGVFLNSKKIQEDDIREDLQMRIK